MGEGSQIFIRFWGAVGQGVVGLGTHEIIINYSFNFFFMLYIYNNPDGQSLFRGDTSYAKDFTMLFHGESLLTNQHLGIGF